MIAVRWNETREGEISSLSTRVHHKHEPKKKNNRISSWIVEYKKIIFQWSTFRLLHNRVFISKMKEEKWKCDACRTIEKKLSKLILSIICQWVRANRVKDEEKRICAWKTVLTQMAFSNIFSRAHREQRTIECEDEKTLETEEEPCCYRIHYYFQSVFPFLRLSSWKIVHDNIAW